MGEVRRQALVVVWIAASVACSSRSVGSGASSTELCDNGRDDDRDGIVDCVDPDCDASSSCQGRPEQCGDALDNDGDGEVDCADDDCATAAGCDELCGNGADDDGDQLIDCLDPSCRGIDPACGEVCGDGVDNDGDTIVDCLDPGCLGVPPCAGTDPLVDGTMCAYQDAVAHPCICGDGLDNDADGKTDAEDLHCFGPFDDDESSYATGIPGDNNGSNGSSECPFDGNSGTGNDGICCNPAELDTNVTPNGCDAQGCCEIDLNANGTGEWVFVRDACDFAPSCGTSGTLGCTCTGDGDCDGGQACVVDGDGSARMCSTCLPCAADPTCVNLCTCGELCFGGFTRPAEECGGTGGGGGGGGTPTCPTDVTTCPGGDGDCDTATNERCVDGCCYSVCPSGLQPCTLSSECQVDYLCVTGCCIERPA